VSRRLGWLIYLALAAMPTTAEEPLPRDPAAVAAEVVSAVRDKREAALKAIAALDDPDPWVIVDELDALDNRPAAEEFAAQVSDEQGGEGLRAYVKSLPRARAPERRAAFVLALRQPREERAAALQDLMPFAALADADIAALDVRVALAMADAVRWSDPEDWKRVVDLARKLGWRHAQLLGLHGHAASLRDADRMDEAFEVMEHAAAWADRHPQWKVSADLAYDLGLYHAWARRDHLAVRELEVAASRYAKRPDCAAEEARALSAIGTRFWSMGDLLTTASYTERALRAAGSADDPLAVLDVRLGAAGTLEQAGQADAALDELAAISDALQKSDAEPWKVEVRRAILEGNRGRSQFLMQLLDDGRRSMRIALDLFTEMEEPEAVLSVLTDLVWIEAEAGGLDDTLDRLEALAEPAQSQHRSPRQHALLLEALGRARRAKGDLQGAQASLRAALDVAPKPGALSPGSTLAVDLVGQLATVVGQAGNHEEALALCEEYLRDSVGGVDGMDRGSRRTFRGIVAGEALAAGVTAARKLSRVEEVWTLTDAARGVRLLASLGGRSRVDNARLPAELVRELERVQVVEETARREVSRLREGGTVEHLKRAGIARDEAATARQQVAKRVADERKRLEREELHELGSMSEILGTQRIQGRLRANEVVLSLHLEPRASSLIAVVLTKTGVRVVDVPDPERIFKALQALREDASLDRRGLAAGEIAKLSERMKEALLILGTALMEPLSLPKEMEYLHVAPDGALAHVPYAALLPSVNVAVTPSASLYEVLRKRGVRTGSRRVAVGLTAYGGVGLDTDVKLATSFSRAPRGGKHGMRMRLGRLQKAAQEAEAVAGAAGTALTETGATSAHLRAELSRERAPRLATLHFSCHGVVHPDLPELSGLALADGLLTAGEIMGLRLDTDLVVLSACDTGSDAFIPGEGMSGLVHAFLLAGSPRVVASLWKVPDDATAYLMERFYEALAKSPEMTAAEALRTAQKLTRTAHEGKWSSPENWAAWTLWGAP
jgi:CHAT domain-containing protein